MRYNACAMFDSGVNCGAEANMAKLWPQTPLGRPPMFACKRTVVLVLPPSTTLRESSEKTRLYQVAPISTNMILSYLGEHILGYAPFLLKAHLDMNQLHRVIVVGAGPVGLLCAWIWPARVLSVCA
jgi:hypothetical protein